MNDGYVPWSILSLGMEGVTPGDTGLMFLHVFSAFLNAFNSFENYIDVILRYCIALNYN